MVRALASSGRTLAVAESFTGGRVAAALTGVPGASGCFLGGIVAYADAAKEGLLDLPSGTLRRDGAVSAASAAAMAEGARRRFGSDYALATTGIAGPSGATDLKPVGLSFVGLAFAGGHWVDRAARPGPRGAVQDLAVEQCLGLLRRRLAWEAIL